MRSWPHAVALGGASGRCRQQCSHRNAHRADDQDHYRSNPDHSGATRPERVPLIGHANLPGIGPQPRNGDRCCRQGAAAACCVAAAGVLHPNHDRKIALFVAAVRESVSPAWFSRPFNSRLVRKKGTHFSSTKTAPPVRGFLADRDARLRTEKTPKPRSSTRPPSASVAAISSRTASTIFSASA